MRARERALGPILGAALWTFAPVAEAFCRTMTLADQPDPTQCPAAVGAPLAWTGGCASLSINPSLLPAGITLDQFRAEVATAAARWSSGACEGGGSPSFHFVAFPDCAHGAEWNPNGSNANTISFRSQWSDDAFHPSLALAVTITTFDRDTGEIHDADTDLNLKTPQNPGGFLFTVATPDASSADLPTILTHEIGHAQGLAHSPDRNAVMWYRAGLGEQRENLTADDLAGICTIYPPGRSATCDPTPHGGFECAPGCSCRAAPAPRARMKLAESSLVVLLGLLAARRRARAPSAMPSG